MAKIELSRNTTSNFMEVTMNKKSELIFLSDQHITNNAYDTVFEDRFLKYIKDRKKQGYTILAASLGDVVDQEQRFTIDVDSASPTELEEAIQRREEKTISLVDKFFNKVQKAGAFIPFAIAGNEDQKRIDNFGIDPYRSISKITFDDHCDLIITYNKVEYVISCFHRVSVSNRKSSIPTKQAAESYFKRNGKVDGIDPSVIIEGHVRDGGVVTVREPNRSTRSRGYTNSQYFVACPSFVNTIQYGIQHYGNKRGLPPVDSGFVSIVFDGKMNEPRIITSSKLLSLDKVN